MDEQLAKAKVARARAVTVGDQRWAELRDSPFMRESQYKPWVDRVDLADPESIAALKDEMDGKTFAVFFRCAMIAIAEANMRGGDLLLGDEIASV